MTISPEDEMLHGVAVVGLAGRFPGAGSVEALWENLKAGRESIRLFTDEELAAAGVSRELIDDPSFVKARGLLERPELFDAAFFGISPHEAELMDPQHRLFLETCWHALENAGYAPASVAGAVGVWGGRSTGMSNDTYLHTNLGGPRGVPEQDVLPAMLGNENDYLCTRVSYKLNLRGPSVNVQSACSTSLIAIVQAFQSLMTYGCDLAIAGGVSVSYPQENGYLHQEGGIGSPDGHCRPFDALAQGTVFSNGVGAVVLKRLDEALDDGDTILAVMRGAASNNDGAAKVSFAAPSVTGQAEVIATALAVADVEPSSVTYVEAHGTGTPIGDPIEVEGLTRAFRRGTDERGFCALGSIKSNFGHLDSAAGVAGFIKAVLCLQHRTLVPTVHFTTPSPRIDWAASPFFVNAETRFWDTDRLPRRAGVSAFGIGGTNAHVVLEEAPVVAPRPSTFDPGPQLLPLSARSAEALLESMRHQAEHLARSPEICLADMARTLQSGREGFRHRAVVVAGDTSVARDLLASGDRTRTILGEVGHAVDRTVFLFPGGGSQYLGMGRDLYESDTELAREIDRGLDLMLEREGLDLRPVWFAEGDDPAAEEAFQRPSVQLPAIFILEMAMARLLMRWGVEPTALIGHSLGENTAACLAGVLSYPDALGLVSLRGRLFDTAAAGGMLSVTASPAALEPFLGTELDLAAVNGPEQCTVSGPQLAIERLAAALDDAGIDAQVVPIDIAAHSSLVEPLLQPFERYLRSVELAPPSIPFLSNRSGTWITDDEATDPGYWAAHLRSTVRFADNVRTVLDAGHPFFLEVGPGRILSSLVKLSDPAVAGRVAATMRHPRDEIADTEALLQAVGRMWVAGADIAWDRIRGDAPGRRIPLPGYPFERLPFLIEPSRDGASGSSSTSMESTSAAGAPTSSVGAGATTAPRTADEALRRVLELQAATNAAIQDLLRIEGNASEPTPANAAHAPTPAPGNRVAEAAEASDEPAPRPDRAHQLAFWTDHLGEPLPVLDLMTDSPRTTAALARRAQSSSTLPAAVGAGMARVAAEEDATSDAVALAAFYGVLHLATGQDDLIVGTAVDRAVSGTEALPLRMRVRRGASFAELVRGTRDLLGEARRNHEVTPQALVEAIGVPEDATRSPLFQASLVWRDDDRGAESGADETATPTDLSVRVTSSSVGTRLTVDYAAGLFDPSTMDDLLAHLVEVLRAGTDDPGVQIGALPAAGPGVMDRIADWNDTVVPLEPVPGLAAWLTEFWESSAEHTAVIAGDVRLRYAELDEQSNRLAHHLIEAGARPGSLVGLCLSRTADLMVAVMGVWKSGAGYVPLDPTYPSARLGLMANRSGLALVVSEESSQGRIEGYDGEWVLVDRDRSLIEACSAERPQVETALTDPAYVLFTSGSTGEPKGVQVSGRNVMNFVASMSRRPGLTESDTLLAVTTLSFDISVLEFALPLRMGATVVLASDTDAMDGPALARLMEAHEVTILQATPSTWRLLLAAGWNGRAGLRALCGGEAFPRDLLRQLLPRVSEVWNMYGPTETTIWSTVARLTDPDAPIVIGSPIENTRCHVLDDEGRRVAPGVPGELYIGGMGVADGYVGRPEETARRFLRDPFPPPEGRMYRTGDAVRWRRDGMLEHLHRADQQVKLRGFRIELGEIEAALAAHEGIGAAVVVLTEIDDSSELVGYVTAEADRWHARALRDSLFERLPPYMVPRTIIRLDQLPLTENGKVDRKALPDPRGDSGWADLDPLEAPETDAEIYLHDIWQEVLDMPAVSVHDNFFDLGGHSLLAVRMIVRVRDDRGVEIPLRALIAGTLRTIAAEYLTGDRVSTVTEGGEEPSAVDRVLGSVRRWISR